MVTQNDARVWIENNSPLVGIKWELKEATFMKEAWMNLDFNTLTLHFSTLHITAILLLHEYWHGKPWPHIPSRSSTTTTKQRWAPTNTLHLISFPTLRKQCGWGICRHKGVHVWKFCNYSRRKDTESATSNTPPTRKDYLTLMEDDLLGYLTFRLQNKVSTEYTLGYLILL